MRRRLLYWIIGCADMVALWCERWLRKDAQGCGTEGSAWETDFDWDKLMTDDFVEARKGAQWGTQTNLRLVEDAQPKPTASDSSPAPSPQTPK